MASRPTQIWLLFTENWSVTAFIGKPEHWQVDIMLHKSLLYNPTTTTAPMTNQTHTWLSHVVSAGNARNLISAWPPVQITSVLISMSFPSAICSSYTYRPRVWGRAAFLCNTSRFPSGWLSVGNVRHGYSSSPGFSLKGKVVHEMWGIQPTADNGQCLYPRVGTRGNDFEGFKRQKGV